MKSILKYLLIISLLIVFASCENKQKTSENEIGKPNKIKNSSVTIESVDNKIDTLNLWFPEEKVKIKFDTVLYIDNDTFDVQLTNYSLDSAVVLNLLVERDNLFYQYYYRNVGVDLNIKINGNKFFNKSFIKDDFDTLVSKELLRQGILRCSFKKVDGNEMFFEFDVNKPETDWIYFVKYYISKSGTIRTELYPDDYYELNL